VLEQFNAELDKECPLSRVEFVQTPDEGFVLKGKFIPADPSRYHFMRLTNAIEGDTFRNLYSNEFSPRYNVSTFLNQIVVIFDAAGMPRKAIEEIKLGHRKDTMKQKHYLTLKGKRPFEDNQIFKDIPLKYLKPDDNYKNRLMDFGNIDMEIEIADLETSVNTREMIGRYYQSNSKEQTGGLFVVVIPKIEEYIDQQQQLNVQILENLVQN